LDVLVFDVVKQEVFCNLVRLTNLYRFLLVRLLDVLVFGEVEQYLCCNLVRLTNVNRFLLVGLLNVQFSGENKNDVMVFGEVI
jgi:hypothetical protein